MIKNRDLFGNDYVNSDKYVLTIDEYKKKEKGNITNIIILKDIIIKK